MQQAFFRICDNNCHRAAILQAMATEKATGRDSDKIMLRVPDGMRDRIAEAAKASNRSMNAEIVARLQGSFDETKTGEWFNAYLKETIAKLQLEVERLTMLGGALGYGIHILYRAFTNKNQGHQTPGIEKEIADILDRADEAVEAAAKADPDDAIAQLRIAQKASKKLWSQLQGDEDATVERAKRDGVAPNNAKGRKESTE